MLSCWSTPMLRNICTVFTVWFTSQHHCFNPTCRGSKPICAETMLLLPSFKWKNALRIRLKFGINPYAINYESVYIYILYWYLYMYQYKYIYIYLLLCLIYLWIIWIYWKSIRPNCQWTHPRIRQRTDERVLYRQLVVKFSDHQLEEHRPGLRFLTCRVPNGIRSYYEMAIQYQ